MRRRGGYIVAAVIVAVWMFGLIAQAQTMVYLEHSETLHFDQKRVADAQILRGNVVFRHDSAWMYCDSAYFYDKTNSLDAFGHVRFVQGDTLMGYGDKLYYNGNTKLARLRQHVKLVHGSTNPTILTTDSLNYDRVGDVAYYFAGGIIRDSLNTLRSKRGYYYPNTHYAVFRHMVELTNPSFRLTTDTLKYNTETKVANLVSPTTIVYDQETNIYSSDGWYNTDTEQSMLLQRSVVEHIDGKRMTGDTIYYDKQKGYGRIIGSMEMCDSVQKITLYGHYGELFHDGDYGYATDSALMVDWSDEDHTYMHADTLYTETISYEIMTVQSCDTIWQDTTYRKMRGYHNVRVYRVDMQAVCDSIEYIGRDSVMVLYTDPVCWNENNQISADTIRIYMRNETVDYIHGIGNALSIRQETPDYYNQMAGKEMIAYVRDGELKQVDVNGNAQTIFYPQEDDGTYLGLNTTQSSYIKVYIEDQQVHHIVFTAETTGTLYPLDQVPVGKDRLSGYFQADAERPRTPDDVFLRPQRTAKPGQAAVSASEQVDDTTDHNLPASQPREKRKLKTR